MKIPDGYHSVQPYLIFKKAGDAIEFYEKAFSATEKLIGNSVIMMADEFPEIQAFGTEHYGGSPISLLIYTEDCDAMYQSALAAGAVSVRVPADQPHGDRMGGVKDPFGYSWYLATHIGV